MCVLFSVFLWWCGVCVSVCLIAYVLVCLFMMFRCLRVCLCVFVCLFCELRVFAHGCASVDYSVVLISLMCSFVVLFECGFVCSTA